MPYPDAAASVARLRWHKGALSRSRDGRVAHALIESSGIILPFTTLTWLWCPVFGVKLHSTRPAFRAFGSKRNVAPEVTA